MTNKQTGTSGLVEVTQADRDAAADVTFIHFSNQHRAMRGGTMDDHETVQAFARHRLTSLSPVPVDGVERLRKQLAKSEADAFRAINGSVFHSAITLEYDDAKAIFAALTASRPSDDGEVERLRQELATSREILRRIGEIGYWEGNGDDLLDWVVRGYTERGDGCREYNASWEPISAALSSLVGGK